MFHRSWLTDRLFNTPFSNHPFLLGLPSQVLTLDVLKFIKKVYCFNFAALPHTTLLMREAYHKISQIDRLLCNL